MGIRFLCMQVSHQGRAVDGGFCSGAPMEAPSACMQQLQRTGVFYFISEAMPKSFGAVIVTSRAKVHEVQVSTNSLTPDPCSVGINDVLAWTFRKPYQHDVAHIESVQALFDLRFPTSTVDQRRVLNRAFMSRGTFHFASKSFLNQNVAYNTGVSPITRENLTQNVYKCVTMVADLA